MSGRADAREECAKLIDAKVAPLLQSGSLPPMWPWWLPLVDAISERLVARNQQLQEALAALLEWAEKDKGGYQFSDPSEEWYAIRDYARAALASVRARSET